MINLEPFTVLIHLVIFLVMVFGVLNPLLFKPMLRVMDERKARVGGNQEAAEDARAQAEELIGTYSEQIKEARQEALREKEGIRKTGENEEDAIIKTAREKSGNMIAELQQKIAAEYQGARQILVSESEAMGKEVAARILGRRV